MRIKMLVNVRPDILFLAKPGTILRVGEEYEAKSNKNGAISGLCANGEYLGVRPGEFVFTDVPERIRDIWAKVCPSALPKPDNPYRKGSLIWSVMEGAWEDLTTAQIAEVLDTSAHIVRCAMQRIKKETGYAVPHVVGRPGGRPEE